MINERDVIFVGGGGHAAVCLDVFRSTGRRVVGYVAPHPTDLELAHIGDDPQLQELAARHSAEVFVAIGANTVRADLLNRVNALGLTVATAIDQSARLARSVQVGAGAVVMPGAVVNTRTTLGAGAIVNTSASVDHDGVVGDCAHVGPGTHLAGNVRLGSGAFLGVGVSVVPGCNIGEWATVGAGATVIGDVPGHTIVVGVPARPIGCAAEELS